MSATAPQTVIQTISIEEIIISEERHRELNMVRAEILQESIFGKNSNGLGLLQPIVLTATKNLVFGLHRVAAYKLEGVDKIPYIIKDLDEIDAELAEIDENLIRFDLTAGERAMHIARRQTLHLQKYGRQEEEIDTSYWDNKSSETGEEGDPGLRDSPTAPVRSRKPPTGTDFIREVAELTGKGTSTIREDIDLGKRLLENLTPEIRELIAPTNSGDNKRDLQRLVDIPDMDTRLEVAQKVRESYDKDPKKQLSVKDVLSALGKENTYESVASKDGAATLERSLKRTESLLNAAVNDPEFRAEAETWTQEAAMTVRDEFFSLQTHIEKGIKILTDVIESNTKLNKN